MNWNFITYAQNIRFLFITNVDLHESPQHSVAVISVVIELNLQGLWSKSCLVLNCLKFHHIIHDKTVSIRANKYPVFDILGSWLIVCCKLAPTLARQMWRHNYVISRNEYIIFTLSESTFPWVYSQQFLFKSTYYSWRYERKCEWVFFLNTVGSLRKSPPCYSDQTLTN